MTSYGNALMLNSTNDTRGTNGTNGTGPGGPPGPPGGPPPLTTEIIVTAVFFCILAVAIVFGNSLVIGAFRVNRRLRTTTNSLLMSLAVADMLIGSISVPIWVYISVTFTYTGLIYDVYLIFDIICGVSSILNLTAISLERCYALLRPIRHRNIGKGVVFTAICATWLLAILAGTLNKMPIPDILLTYYGIEVTTLFFFLPLIIILAAYGTIFHIARAHARGRGVRSFKKELRIATTVAVVIGLFIVCWTPFFALNFWFSYCLTNQFQSPGCQVIPPAFVLNLNKWLQYGNSVCNPIIYGLRNKDFRLAFRKILLGLCGKNVRLTDYSKSAYGRTMRTAYTRQDSSIENSRSVIFPPQANTGMFDMRESYRKAIQNGRHKPIKLKFTKKTLADGLLALNVEAFHSLPSRDSTSNLILSSTSCSTPDVTSSPGELCNPGFEDDHLETGIYPFNQAPTRKNPDENVQGSSGSLHQENVKGSVQNGASRVHFVDSNEPDDFGSPQTASTLAPLDRKRSLSEVFHRSHGKSDSLKQELRSSFS